MAAEILKNDVFNLFSSLPARTGKGTINATGKEGKGWDFKCKQL